MPAFTNQIHYGPVTGRIDKLTIALDRPQLTSEDERRLKKAAENAADRSQQ
jgi:hypothetical protein